MGPDISYIVSAFNRPELLPRCLTCLKVQTHKSYEVIVTDNAVDPKIAALHKKTVQQIEDSRFKYFRTAGKIKVSDCFWSAEWAVKHVAKGNWYAFPCDDTIYGAEWGQRMLGAAHTNGWDFVLCSRPIVGPAASGGSLYAVWPVGLNRSIKTAFIVRADRFKGFEYKPTSQMPANADYMFGVQMMRDGVPSGMIAEPMMFHE